MKKGYILIIFFSFFLFCSKRELKKNFITNIYYFFFPKIEFESCDPFYSYYENGTHYFYDENLTNDGTIQYRKLFELKNLEKNPCNPLNKK